MRQPLVVVGAGGFGRETLDVVGAANLAAPQPVFDLLGVIDDAPSKVNLKRLAVRDIPYLGSLGQWLATQRDAAYVVGVGSPRARQRLVDILRSRGYAAATVVHPEAVIGSASTIGTGTVICAGVQVSTNVSVGDHVHLNPHSTVGHDARLEDFVSVNPAATISGECTLEAGCLIGASAVVLQGLVVEHDATVGAAACVTQDVLSGAIVKGVPAR